MKVFEFWKKYLMSFYILISSHHFILDILFKKFAKNEFLYSIKNNSPYGIKKQKNTSTWDTEVTPNGLIWILNITLKTVKFFIFDIFDIRIC